MALINRSIEKSLICLSDFKHSIVSLILFFTSSFSATLVISLGSNKHLIVEVTIRIMAASINNFLYPILAKYSMPVIFPAISAPTAPAIKFTEYL